MNKLNIGDRVVAVKNSEHYAKFKRGDKGTVTSCVEYNFLGVVFDKHGTDVWTCTPDEIELIEQASTGHVDLSLKEYIRTGPEHKPFPSFEEFINELVKADPRHKERFCYNYFAQFGVRTVEVFPEVGKEYQFGYGGENWLTDRLLGFSLHKAIGTYTHIRPVQPNRLEQLKARKGELSREELLELITLMEST
jgi:hypothetical protein